MIEMLKLLICVDNTFIFFYNRIIKNFVVWFEYESSINFSYLLRGYKGLCNDIKIKIEYI